MLIATETRHEHADPELRSFGMAGIAYGVSRAFVARKAAMSSSEVAKLYL